MGTFGGRVAVFHGLSTIGAIAPSKLSAFPERVANFFDSKNRANDVAWLEQRTRNSAGTRATLRQCADLDEELATEYLKQLRIASLSAGISQSAADSSV